MTIPTDYIFTSGTVRKDGIYDLIITKLVAAGWVDISSKSTTDYVVLSSNGNNADKALLLNLRDVNVAATNSVKTTVYNTMSYRLQDTYVPGTAGAAGVFGRPSLAWTPLDIVPSVVTTGTLAIDTAVNYKVYADKSKIILALEYPIATGYGPLLIYMGQPDTVWVSESGNRGILVATTANSAVAGSVQICNSPDRVGSLTAPYAMLTLALAPARNPNADGVYFDSSICYQSTAEGIRGKLDGILSILNQNTFNGDTETINGNTYYTLVCHTQGLSSFASQAFLIRIA